VRAARHVVRAAVKAGRLDGSKEGDDGTVGSGAGREIPLDGMSRRFALVVGTVDRHEDKADRRAFPAALVVFPAAALTFRSTSLVFRSTSPALPSTLHSVKADRAAVEATVPELAATL
jgi:hypothetical protein